MLRIVPLLYPVSAAHTSIFRMDSNSTSYSSRSPSPWSSSGDTAPCRMSFRSFRFFELPADTGTCSAEKPCFLSDHIQAPPVERVAAETFLQNSHAGTRIRWWQGGPNRPPEVLGRSEGPTVGRMGLLATYGIALEDRSSPGIPPRVG
jgi:hypothetical protein